VERAARGDEGKKCLGKRGDEDEGGANHGGKKVSDERAGENGRRLRRWKRKSGGR
jgi:hypothetical protein